MKLLDWIDTEKLLRSKTLMILLGAMNAGFVIGSIAKGNLLGWHLLNLLVLCISIVSYFYIHHRHYFKKLHLRLKDIWKLLRNKEHIIVISSTNENLKNAIDKKGLSLIQISTHNLVTYPAFVMLKQAADIVTDDEMILYRAEFQFKLDEYNNQKARESINKEEKQ